MDRQARRPWKARRNCYPSLAYAHGDRRTFYIAIDGAANMAGLTRRNFYNRYLLSDRLPYVVKTWFQGRKMRRKSFAPRGAMLELLIRELHLRAKQEYDLRGRKSIIRGGQTPRDLSAESSST